MKNTFGESVAVTLFGESHGEAIGAVIDGLAPGIPVDEDFIRAQLTLRRPRGPVSTARQESDPFRIVSGCFGGYTTGTPLTILIPNSDTKSKDYSKTKDLARPGHADLTAQMKYHGFQDYRGGGHFSGRITAALVAAGAVAITALKQKGVVLRSHIRACAGVEDRPFAGEEAALRADLAALEGQSFPVLEPAAAAAMEQAILAAREDRDSVGGILETAVCGLPAGVGEPWFDTVEGVLAHALFSIPAVKGVEFGSGFALAGMRGSRANDPFRVEEGRFVTATNHNGGVNGGITNVMPVVFRTAVKPTPSIFQTQDTVDFVRGENAPLTLEGRHDPAIVHRAAVVADSVTALALCDLLALRFGTDWLAEQKKGG